MTQGAEGDLKDIRYYDNASTVDHLTDNEPVNDLNDNILTIDNKAVLAKTLANDAAAQLLTHIGGSGTSAHPNATTSISGFLSSADKLKLNNIQVEAQINILSPVDALELVSGRTTSLHRHINASPTVDGFMSTADRIKLTGIATGANVNFPVLADADALARNPGGDANPLHVHTSPTFFETFRESGAPIGGVTYHDEIDHSVVLGVPPAFPGFSNKSTYNVGPEQVGIGVTVFVQPYFAFTTLDVVTAGFQFIHMRTTVWGNHRTFQVNDVAISGTNGIITYEIFAYGTNPHMACWQAGYGA